MWIAVAVGNGERSTNALHLADEPAQCRAIVTSLSHEY